MKIRSKFYLSTFFLLGMILMIGSVQLFSSLRLNTAYETQRNVDEIFFLVSGTNRITLDYLREPSDRAYNQLLRIQHHFDNVFTRTTSATPTPQSRLLKKIRRNYDDFWVIFDIYLKKTDNPHIRNDSQLKELLDRISSQLLILTADIVSDTTQLSDLVRKDLIKIHQQNRRIVLSTVIIVSIFVVLISILITRSITNPIYEIRKGTKKFGKGNLEYRITPITKDEIGELSEAFNLMAENLNKVTVSKEKLVFEIEERKLAEENLRNSEGRFRNIFENIQDVYYETSPNGAILEASPSIETVFGYKREEAIGKSINEFYTDPKEREAFLDAIVNSGKVTNYEVTLIDKDGAARSIELTSMLQRDQKGDSLKIIGSMRDISERKLLETKLVQSQKMESIGQLAGGIAHDFNNVLYPIIGFAQLSQSELAKDHPVQEYLMDIVAGAKRASDLVKRILLFSRQKQQVLKPTILQPVIEECYKLMRSTIPTYIDLKLELYSGEDFVLCNESEIHEIILNLCTNSYHAIVGDHGQIILMLKKEEPPFDLDLDPGEYLCLSVKDNGVGIPKKIQDKIFEPYATTKDVGKGSGLGLAVVYGIIQTFRGAISVKSDSEKGTEIRVFLPIMQDAGTNENREGFSKQSLSGDESILFVDDEKSIVKLGVRTLNNYGYSVTGSYDSIEALNLFKASPDQFDLVITDMSMPNMAGSKLSKKLLEIRPDLPIIICSGYSEKLDKEKVRDLKVAAYLDKPLSVDDLLRITRKVLDKSIS